MKIPVAIEVDGNEKDGYQCGYWCPFKDDYHKICTLFNHDIVPKEKWGQIEGYKICLSCHSFIRENKGEAK